MWPPPIFSKGFQPKPSFATGILGGGHTPTKKIISFTRFLPCNSTFYTPLPPPPGLSVPRPVSSATPVVTLAAATADRAPEQQRRHRPNATCPRERWRPRPNKRPQQYFTSADGGRMYKSSIIILYIYRYNDIDKWIYISIEIYRYI